MRKPGSRFNRDGVPVTFEYARDLLLRALIQLGARDIVLTHDDPMSARAWRTPSVGVAVYFTIDGKPLVIPQDMFESVAANCRSVGIVVEAMATIKRHGGGAMVSKAFDGFAALPPPSSSRPAQKRSRSWREVLGLDDGVWVDRETVEAAFRARAKEVHPDAGGSHEAMSELNAARAQALKEIGG
jgi:hypothetical protein